MADIRIKDLTTTASSSASDDFIAIDGTTNGTRKLNAFSPTFGGNATVTGTLTANSTFASTSSGTTLTSQFSNTLTGATNVLNLQLRRGDSANGFSRLMWNTGSTTEWSFGSRAGDTNLYVWDEVANAERLKIASSTGNVSIASTSASTTTSSGALVVSGGVGIGGSLNAGAANAANSITGGDSGSGTYILQLKDGGGNLKVNFKGNGDVNLQSSTASTSTSSGALVVSGGVGVAKRIHSGEGLTTGGDNETHISFVRNGTVSIGPTSAATPKLAVGGGLQLSNTSQSIPAWGDVGAQLSIAGAVITDTTSSGTVSRFVSNSISASSIAASSPTTYTQAASLFIAAGPTANTNVTISNSYALFIAGGRINFGGLPTSSAGLQAGTLWNDSGTLKVA